MITLGDSLLRTGKNPVRSTVNVADFTLVAKTVRMRVQLELQRRYMGNTTEQIIDGLQLEIDDRTLIALLLDVRTCHNKKIMTDERAAKAFPLLETAYKEFRMKTLTAEHEAELEAKASQQSLVPESQQTSQQQESESQSESQSQSQSESQSSQSNPYLDYLLSQGIDEEAAAAIEGASEVSAEQIEAERVEKEAEDLQNEWLRAIVNWMKLVVVWSDFMRLDTGVKFPPSPDIMMLMYFPIALFMSKLMAENKGSRPYGWLPEMALTFIGQLMASSYVERVNSAAKLILNKKNLKLKDETLDKLTVLRMNREFMVQMRAIIPSLAEGPSGSFESYVEDSLLTPSALAAEAAAAEAAASAEAE